MNNQDLDLARLAIEFGLTGRTELRRPTVNVLLALIDELEELRGKAEPEPEIDVELLCAVNGAYAESALCRIKAESVKLFIKKELIISIFYTDRRFFLTKKGFDLLRLTASAEAYRTAVIESRNTSIRAYGVYVP